MKKGLLLLPLLFVFVLISCSGDDDYIVGDSSDAPTNETTNNEDELKQEDNKDIMDDSKTEEIEEESPLPDYEDDTEWKGKIF